jgi:mono/diheme cytochrome c family protein
MFLLSVFCAAQQVEIKRVPIKYVPASSGEQMYQAYCSACHGKDGRGTGPAARALNTPPADLTVLAQRNQGRFREVHVYNKILGHPPGPGRDTKEMPMWGSLFSSLAGGTPSGQAEVHHRASMLTSYVALLQE